MNDGSTDDTAHVAARFDVTLIEHIRNLGKGAAMQSGVEATDAQIIFFCDADVVGLTHRMIRKTIEPVLLGEVDMLVAMRDRLIYKLRYILRVIPLLGGERALNRALWESIPEKFKDNFKIEIALNFYASHSGNGFDYKVFKGLSQTIKEKKYGLVKGLIGRLKMSGDVAAAYVALHWHERTSNLVYISLLFAVTAGAVPWIIMAVVHFLHR